MVSSPLKVLLIDDDEDDYIVTQDLLNDAEITSFHLDWVDEYDAALGQIEQRQHQVYLLDYRLGGRDGLELLQDALAQGCQEPIIVLTGLGDHDIDQAAMKLGAADYLVKGQINTPLLERSILHAIERKQSELRQAQLLKELAVANQDLKDFAYIVSHDLKAPLRGINSLADWLVADYGDKLDTEGREMLQLLKGRTRRMQDLIEGVLQYSRLGRIREEKTTVDLNQVIADVVDAIAPSDSIHINVATPLPILTIEKVKIYQVFQNLISNAVKYIDKSLGKVVIGCIDKGMVWEFSVADNGPGIEEKHFERIFHIFQTLTARDDLESTGIGLTLVKKIIEMYGGSVWLTSQLGEGSTFYVTLPKSA